MAAMTRMSARLGRITRTASGRDRRLGLARGAGVPARVAMIGKASTNDTGTSKVRSPFSFVSAPPNGESSSAGISSSTAAQPPSARGSLGSTSMRTTEWSAAPSRDRTWNPSAVTSRTVSSDAAKATFIYPWTSLTSRAAGTTHRAGGLIGHARLSPPPVVPEGTRLPFRRGGN